MLTVIPNEFVFHAVAPVPRPAFELTGERATRPIRRRRRWRSGGRRGAADGDGLASGPHLRGRGGAGTRSGHWWIASRRPPTSPGRRERPGRAVGGYFYVLPWGYQE